MGQGWYAPRRLFLLRRRRLSSYAISGERQTEPWIGDIGYIKQRLDALIPAGGGAKWRERGEYLDVRECPLPNFCGKSEGYSSRHGKGNQYTLTIHRQSCGFRCFRCGISGSEKKLRYKLSGLKIETSSTSYLHDTSGSHVPRVEDETRFVLPSVMKIEEWAQYPRRLLEEIDDDAKKVLRYLQEDRGLSLDVIALYGLGAKSERFYDKIRNDFVIENCVTFPWFSTGRQIDMIRLKVRSIETKANMRLDPKGGAWGLFGLGIFKHLQPDTKFIVLTEGEYDAMAVHQATRYPAVSLPNGATSLHPSLVEELESYETIFFWLDNDEAGKSAAQKFAKKIGLNRCRFVRNCDDWPSSIKDANDALRQGLDLTRAINQAALPQHEKIATFADYRDTVFTEIRNPVAFGGTQCESFPGLMKKLRGIRRGEMTLLTGPTGAGKTTFASQISLDLASQGVNTLWGSFEVKIAKLIQKMLKQKYQQRFGGKHRPLLEHLDESKFIAILDQFDTLPLHFLTYHGATSIEEVIDAMSFACDALDVDFICLDNLQFMTSTTSAHNDKFAAQDRAISLLRKFATDNNCHVLLVVHPRKELPDVPLTIHSIYGGVKATQEADNVLILNDAPHVSGAVVNSTAQKRVNNASTYGSPPPVTTTAATTNKFKSLDLVKNREAGELGSVILMFDAISNSYLDNHGSPSNVPSSSSSKINNTYEGQDGGTAAQASSM